MKSGHKVLWILLIGLVWGEAFGQGYKVFQDELNDIMKNTKWTLGPLKIYPLLQLRNVGYDDNVYYENEEDRPAEDYTGTLSPE
ncbi:MAG: hypothetical protein WCC06_00505, partial [Candidatus Aminicenantales bacterium]